jgi:hypothetical protein
LSTVVAPQILPSDESEVRHHQASGQRKYGVGLGIITLLAGFSFVVSGYHPYAEDGGIYVAGVKWLLDPGLYSHSVPFVEAHLRFSLFAPMVATVVRVTHISLPIVLSILHLASIWATLFAAWLLVRRCYDSKRAQWGAVTLLAACVTMPVAGTSLILMDPYLTARSISLPCTLLAMAALIDWLGARSSAGRGQAALLCGGAMLLAALVHPLMAAYGMGALLLLSTTMSQRRVVRRWGTAALCLCAMLLAGILNATAAHEVPGYVAVAVTRYYWFLSRWQWYELVGVVAPLLILAGIGWWPRDRSGDALPPTARRGLARMAVAAGGTAILIVLAFAHEISTSYLVARLQPLRIFQVIYLLMILFLGAVLGEEILGRRRWRWVAAFSLIGGLMFFVQRSTYPSSPHIEWPGASPANGWEQAFVWISRNTPKDALFALDADYISAHGEDAQSFRTVAERSSLPDYSKDGGEASITPYLTESWVAGQRAQMRLSDESDSDRMSALRPFNVTWVVLQRHAQTSLVCPYQNDLVRVCRLR